MVKCVISATTNRDVKIMIHLLGSRAELFWYYLYNSIVFIIILNRFYFTSFNFTFKFHFMLL